MSLEDLFRSHGTLRAVIESVLERGLGQIDSDDAQAPHVARLRLDGFLADLREVARLVHHPALGPAHPDRAGLARVARAESAVEAHHAARLASLAQHVADGGKAAAGADEGCGHVGRLGERGQRRKTTPALSPTWR